jgi:hypothetical protein
MVSLQPAGTERQQALIGLGKQGGRWRDGRRSGRVDSHFYWRLWETGGDVTTEAHGCDIVVMELYIQ